MLAASPPRALASPPALPARWGDEDTLMPVVAFLNGREIPMPPVQFDSEVPGLGKCCRLQVGGVEAWWRPGLQRRRQRRGL